MTAATLPRILYSTAEVAEMTGYSRRAIVHMCSEGHLGAFRIGGRGDWRVPAKVVDALRNGGEA